MKELKHDDFSSLMLQIESTSEEDLLFNFMDGLKPWAAQELKHHKVENIPTAFSVARPSIRAISRCTVKAGEKGRFCEPPLYVNIGKAPMRESKNKARPIEGCFSCGGTHWLGTAQRKALSAIVEQQERVMGRLWGALKLLNTLNVKLAPNHAGDKGLMFVEGRTNGKTAQLKVDSRASHNFISPAEAVRT